MTAAHPAMLRAGSHPVWSDEARDAQRMLEVYENLFDDLAELMPSDAAAYGMMKTQVDRLAGIVQHRGSQPVWIAAQYGRIHSEANRLLPAFLCQTIVTALGRLMAKPKKRKPKRPTPQAGRPAFLDTLILKRKDRP
jgi:hypothetical protein